jgi:hypothetical protein
MREIMLAFLAHPDLDVEAVVRWSGAVGGFKLEVQRRRVG